MLIRILNAALILVAVYMGFKQGLAMLNAKPEMLSLFGKWHFNKTGVVLNGVITIISALLILFPKTFLLGNFIMAAGILLIICFCLSGKDLKAATIELPFLLMNLVIIYLQHPLAKIN